MDIDWFSSILLRHPLQPLLTDDHVVAWPNADSVDLDTGIYSHFSAEGHASDDCLGATIGHPEIDSVYWSEQHGQTCAVMAQQGVIYAITGQYIPEAALEQVAYEHGWFDPASGTSPESMGNMLSFYGIPNSNQTGLSITDIAVALEHGEKVIVALDANEIWTPQSASGAPLEQPNGGHAVWVTGIKVDEQTGEYSVVLNDTGRPDGRGFTIHMADFINAWDDYGNRAVITNIHA